MNPKDNKTKIQEYKKIDLRITRKKKKKLMSKLMKTVIPMLPRKMG